MRILSRDTESSRSLAFSLPRRAPRTSCPADYVHDSLSASHASCSGSSRDTTGGVSHGLSCFWPCSGGLLHTGHRELSLSGPSPFPRSFADNTTASMIHASCSGSPAETQRALANLRSYLSRCLQEGGRGGVLILAQDPLARMQDRLPSGELDRERSRSLVPSSPLPDKPRERHDSLHPYRHSERSPGRTQRAALS